MSFKEVDQGKHTCISADILIRTYHGIVTMDKTLQFTNTLIIIQILSANMRLAFHKDRDVKMRQLRLWYLSTVCQCQESCDETVYLSIASQWQESCDETVYLSTVSVSSLVIRRCTY